jgi:hypothetical protein
MARRRSLLCPRLCGGRCSRGASCCGPAMGAAASSLRWTMWTWRWAGPRARITEWLSHVSSCEFGWSCISRCCRQDGLRACSFTALSTLHFSWVLRILALCSPPFRHSRCPREPVFTQLPLCGAAVERPGRVEAAVPVLCGAGPPLHAVLAALPQAGGHGGGARHRHGHHAPARRVEGHHGAPSQVSQPSHAATDGVGKVYKKRAFSHEFVCMRQQCSAVNRSQDQGMLTGSGLRLSHSPKSFLLQFGAERRPRFLTCCHGGV